MKPFYLIALLAAGVLTFTLWLFVNRANSSRQQIEFVEDCVDEYYHHWTQFEGYDGCRRIGEKLLAFGEAERDDEIQARALARLAFCEIKFAKWGNDWSDKLTKADLLTQGRNSIARADYLTMSGWIKGNWESKFEDGLAELNEAIRIAKLHRNDKALVFASLGATQILDYLERPNEATEVAYFALHAAKNLGDRDLLTEVYKLSLARFNVKGLEKYVVDLAQEFKKFAPDDCRTADHILFHAGVSEKISG